MGLRGQISGAPIEETKDIPLDPEFTRMQTMGFAFDRGVDDAGFNSVLKMMHRSNEEDLDLPEIGVEELQEKMPGPKWDKPVNQAVATSIFDEFNEEQQFQRKLALGPQDFGTKAWQFGAQLMAHAADPVELAGAMLISAAVPWLGATMVASKSFSGVALKAAKAVQRGRVIKNIGGVNTEVFATNTFKRAAVENVLGNAAVEPFIAQAQIQDLRDYDAFTGFVNVVGGGLGMAGLTHGLGRAVGWVKRLGEGAAEIKGRKATVQLTSGQSVDVDPELRYYTEVTKGNLPSDASVKAPLKLDHEFSPIITGKTGQAKWFAVGTKKTAQLNKSNTQSFGTQYHGSEGITVITDPNMANAQGALPTRQTTGMIFEVQHLEGKNIIDMDTHLPVGSKGEVALRAALEEDFGEKLVNKVLKDDPTLKQIYENVQDLQIEGRASEELFTDMNLALKDSGIDGYHYVQSKVAGKAHKPTNAMTLFDEPEVVGRFEPDPRVVPKPTQELLKEISDGANKPENRLFHSPEADAALKEAKVEPVKDVELNQVRLEEQASLDEVEILKGQDKLSAEELIELENIKKAPIADELEEAATKQIHRCLLNGGA